MVYASSFIACYRLMREYRNRILCAVIKAAFARMRITVDCEPELGPSFAIYALMLEWANYG